ncbi:unnamed protein product [Mytilus coruscus]|uniref:Uncharacterized protein n=1 Tax=Mytilus coruscus TaxID=42192 RepID=A0A6J8DBJ4_MYTCO|nr:unnamed protein product [Mytilus coruscus]
MVVIYVLVQDEDIGDDNITDTSKYDMSDNTITPECSDTLDGMEDFIACRYCGVFIKHVRGLTEHIQRGCRKKNPIVVPIQLILASASNSVGSDSASLLSCSKFHFEEKVLEKLIRLEHKMELNEKKLKKWEDAFSFKLEKMDEAIKQTETFVKSVPGIQLQEQLRINYSYHEIVERFKIQSKNETKFHGEQIYTLLESLSSKIKEFSVAEKKQENAVESLQNALHQEQNRFN